MIGVTFGAFGRGRGHWSHGGFVGRGPWMDGPAGGPGASGRGAGGPRGPWDAREAFVAEMHRHLHERDAAAGSTPPAHPGAPAPGTPTGA